MYIIKIFMINLKDIENKKTNFKLSLTNILTFNIKICRTLINT